MRFEVSERIVTNVDKEQILRGLEEQFRKVSQSLTRNGDSLEIKSIEASFGSINRSDTTVVSLKDTDDGFLLLANVHYRPSIAFWIILILTLFTYVFWLLPIIFYLVQKKTVQTGIQDVFTRVRNEFMSSINQKIQKQDMSSIQELSNLFDSAIAKIGLEFTKNLMEIDPLNKEKLENF